MDLIKYDQHFMVDLELLDKIASKCKAKEVVEVGPGNGVLTERLLKHSKVTAIEIDQECVKNLKEKFSSEIKSGKLEIIEGNVLELKLKGKILFSNLPYAISEPFFYKLIKSDFEHIFLVTGENFYKLLIGAEKIGFFRKNLFKIDFHETVSKTAFEPQPRVNSSFFSLHRKQNDDFYSIFLMQFDKKLKNALIESFVEFYDITKKEAKERVRIIGLKETVLDKRVYHLSNAQFMAVVNEINSKL